ncbi:MAG: DEAD/DEAH box helicase [Limnochordia bacterium]
MNPIEVAEQLKSTFRRYLQTTFPLGKTQPVIRRQLSTLLDSRDSEHHLFRGPYLEATPPYQVGCSLAELAQEPGGVEWELLRSAGICPDVTDAGDEGKFPFRRKLFAHQERALRLADAGENYVVATGTGSGKTETFLLPIFKYCLMYPGRGVRALLIYPMNALVHDQMERLRKYLRGSPIRFGHFIGDTPHSRDAAMRSPDYVNTLPNEVTSREEIRENPPDILITNYTMLEYLLLRPGDNILFGPENRDEHAWRYLVLDEAHTYVGAQGVEIGYLIRRLKDAVGRGVGVAPEQRMRVIATSATLADEGDGAAGIARFASDLFGEPFRPENVIRSQPDSVLDKVEGTQLISIPDPVSFYLSLPSPDELTGRTKEWIVERFGLLVDATEYEWSGVEKFVADVLIRNADVHRLWKSITERPRDVRALARELFPDSPQADAEQALVRLVELGNFARLHPEGASILPARYHFFVSGLAGIFADLRASADGSPWRRLALTTRELEDDGPITPVEIAVCTSCGGAYAAGIISKDPDGKRRLKPMSQSIFESSEYDVSVGPHFFSFQQLCEEQAEVSFCPRCGVVIDGCTCRQYSRCVLYAVKDFRGSSGHGGCLYCHTGPFRSKVRLFRSPQHGPAAVLAEELYRQLPGLTHSEIERVRQTNAGRFQGRNASPVTGEARKLLIFSDNRQQAGVLRGFPSENAPGSAEPESPHSGLGGHW